MVLNTLPCPCVCGETSRGCGCGERCVCEECAAACAGRVCGCACGACVRLRVRGVCAAARAGRGGCGQPGVVGPTRVATAVICYIILYYITLHYCGGRPTWPDTPSWGSSRLAGPARRPRPARGCEHGERLRTGAGGRGRVAARACAPWLRSLRVVAQTTRAPSPSGVRAVVAQMACKSMHAGEGAGDIGREIEGESGRKRKGV
jgi:hypothetical protein